MRIISKYKDYYDYLVGIYGIDNKIVFKRDCIRFRDMLHESKENRMITIHICGTAYDAIIGPDGKLYWGEDIEPLGKKLKKGSYEFWWLRKEDEADPENTVKVSSLSTVSGVIRHYYPRTVPRASKENQNKNCPILLEIEMLVGRNKFYKFPLLSDLGFAAVVPAEDMWISIYNWLSATVDIPNTQTDKEKIVSHGFDVKSSFRHPVNKPKKKHK